MKNKITNKGITLIALVITIIVMLILVAVTISMAVNGGLFDYAGKATGETKNAINEEYNLAGGGVIIGEKHYNSIDEYLNENLGTKAVHSWTRSGDTFTCSHCNTTYIMGQTVSYTATGISTWYTERLSDKLDYGPQEIPITSENTTWVVLGMDDTDKDGVNETLLITSLGPVGFMIDGLESATLSMQGASGYNNGPSEINRICKELYSNSEYGEARGMTIEDVNAAINYTPRGGEYFDSAEDTLKTTGNLTTKLKDLPIFGSLTGNETYTPDGSDTEAALGEYELNEYYVYSTTGTMTQVENDIIFGADVDYVYWLASRGVGVDSSYAYFGVGLVDEGYFSSVKKLFQTNGMFIHSASLPIRPVVMLKDRLPE